MVFVWYRHCGDDLVMFVATADVSNGSDMLLITRKPSVRPCSLFYTIPFVVQDESATTVEVG